MGLFDDDTNDQTDDNDKTDAVSKNSTGGFEPSEQIVPHAPGKYKRTIDEEAGVVIYAANSNNGYALAAVPLEETQLEHTTSNEEID